MTHRRMMILLMIALGLFIIGLTVLINIIA